MRGYANLLFHRGIFEYKSLQESVELMRNRNACASKYVEGTWAFSDLQNYAKATITHSNGTVEVIIK